MQNDTAELLASIDASIQGLLFRTEADYALKSFVWDVSTQGEFNISRLLKSTDNLVAIELDDFLSWGEYLEDFERWKEFLAQNPEYSTYEQSNYSHADVPLWMDVPLWTRQNAVRKRAEEYDIARSESAVMKQRYQSLVEALQAYASDLQVYRVVKYDETVPSNDYSNDRRSSRNVFESFKILVGKVSNNCWMGISPISSYVEFPTRPTPEKFLTQRIEQHITEEFAAKFRPIIDDLTFIMRRCYDRYERENQYACEFAETEEAVINRLIHLSNFLTTWNFEGMALGGEGLEGVYNFEEGDDGLEGAYVLEFPEEEGKFDLIDQLLRSHLKNLRIHIIGSISVFDIYAIGQAQSGNWLGVSTIAVWT